MRKALSLSQHHDAVTGTEKQHVANDYVYRLSKAEITTKEALSQAVKRRAELLKSVKIDGNLLMCHRLNTTYHDCPTEFLLPKAGQLKNNGTQVILVVQNPGKSLKNQLINVRIPNGLEIQVKNQQDNVVKSQIICHFNSIDECILYFKHSLPEISITLFKLKLQNNSKQMVFGNKYDKWENITAKSIDQNRVYKLLHDHKNNTFVYQQQILKPSKLIQLQLNLTHRYYNSYQGDGQTSGAYIFRPDPADAQSQILNTKTPQDYQTYVYKGKLVQEFWHEHQHTRMLIRLNNKGEIEVETFMREIPLSSQGRQVTFNIQTGLNNQNIFYTDSTGMAMQRRELNKRPQLFNYTTVQPISSNYFPLTSAIMFQQNVSKTRVSVFTDRSQGGGVIKPGRIQMMVNRRLYKDDYKGVNEALNQTNADGTKGLEFWVTHRIQIKDFDEDQLNGREVGINQPINLLFGKAKKDSISLKDRFQSHIELDSNIKLNIYPVAAGIRVRLQNIMDAVNGNEKTSVIVVNVKKLAIDLYAMMNGQTDEIDPKIVSLSLSGNQLYEQVVEFAENMQWLTQDGPIQYEIYSTVDEDYSKVQLLAQEHRLFEFKYTDNDEKEVEYIY